MSKPTVPADIADALTSLRTAIRRLQQANPLERASITRGLLTVRDTNGDPRVEIGLLDEGGSIFGLRIRDSAGLTRFRVDDDGFQQPYLAAPVIDTTAFHTVTSSTFVSAGWQGNVESVSHKGLYVWVFVTADASTDGEIRIVSLNSGAATVALPISGGELVHTQARWLHGDPLGTGPQTYQLQARRTSGTGNINVYSPLTITMAPPGLCTANGF